jgi:hypothetical protein
MSDLTYTPFLRLEIISESVSSLQLVSSASCWNDSLPVFSKNWMVVLTTARSGAHFSFGPSSSCPVLTSFLVPHPPRKQGTSSHLSPVAARSSLRGSVHREHDRTTCLTVSSSFPHSHFAPSTMPPRARYWFSRQSPG